MVQGNIEVAYPDIVIIIMSIHVMLCGVRVLASEFKDWGKFSDGCQLSPSRRHKQFRIALYLHRPKKEDAVYERKNVI